MIAGVSAGKSKSMAGTGANVAVALDVIDPVTVCEAVIVCSGGMRVWVKNTAYVAVSCKDPLVGVVDGVGVAVTEAEPEVAVGVMVLVAPPGWLVTLEEVAVLVLVGVAIVVVEVGVGPPSPTKIV